MTIRPLLTLAVAAAVSLWASAQPSTAGLTAAAQLQLLKTNRELLEDLLDQGMLVADANTPLDRAAACQRSIDRMARELQPAVARSDADRANEIGDYVERIVVDGFVPNFEIARRDAKPGSPDFERVKTMHAEAHKSLDTLSATLPSEGPLSKSKRLQQARAKLADASAKLGKPDDR